MTDLLDCAYSSQSRFAATGEWSATDDWTQAVKTTRTHKVPASGRKVILDPTVDLLVAKSALSFSSVALLAGDALELVFSALADNWQNETDLLSSTEAKQAPASFRAIEALGSAAVPLIIRRMATEPGHWFDLLEYLTGEDAAIDVASKTEATDAWLKWGQKKGYLV